MAIGECGVFVDFNAEAKWQMANPVFLLKGRLLALSANTRLGWPFAIRFSVKIRKACGECAAFARDECASYCKKSKPTNVKISITLITGGGSKTDTGASAPV